ncbi:MAG: hypothetical protein QM739_09480 [Propionivibrio sp.]
MISIGSRIPVRRLAAENGGKQWNDDHHDAADAGLRETDEQGGYDNHRELPRIHAAEKPCPLHRFDHRASITSIAGLSATGGRKVSSRFCMLLEKYLKNKAKQRWASIPYWRFVLTVQTQNDRISSYGSPREQMFIFC